MKTRDIEELLSTHAEGLAAGRRHDYPPASASGDVQPLLDVARRVHHRLTPIEPRPDFVAGLWERLQPSDVVIPASAPTPRIWVWVVAGVGGLISLASLVVILMRLGSVVFRWISGKAVSSSAEISNQAQATT
jgi:hypothetical protein